MCVPLEKCAQTLVFLLMLSVLMEVELSLDSSVFLSSFTVLLRCLFPKDGVIEQADKVRIEGETDREVNGVSLFSVAIQSSSCCLTLIGMERCGSA